jgi:hypothetical protein
VNPLSALAEHNKTYPISRHKVMLDPAFAEIYDVPQGTLISLLDFAFLLTHRSLAVLKSQIGISSQRTENLKFHTGMSSCGRRRKAKRKSRKRRAEAARPPRSSPENHVCPI